MAVASKESKTILTPQGSSLVPIGGAVLLILLCAYLAVAWAPIVAAEITVAATAIAILVADWFVPKEKQSQLGLLGIFGLMAAIGMMIGVRTSGYEAPAAFGGMFITSGFSTLFRLMILGTGALSLTLSLDYVGRRITQYGEYYVLIVLAILGGMLLAAANEMVTFYLALELVSIPSYILVSLRKSEARSSEAGLKYLIFGALSSAFLLYGFSWVFGMTGTTDFSAAAVSISNTGVNPPLVFAMALCIAGVLYKVSAAPFHMWTPDVYEGAPMPVTAFLAMTSKLIGVAALLKLLVVPFSSGQLETRWVLMIAVLSAVTMTLGNLVALAQRNIKRLFAYSSIAHGGYLLSGMVAAYRPDTLNASLGSVTFYLITYALMNLGAFAVMLYVGREQDSAELSAYAGLAKRAPWTAAIFSLCLMSLAGLPPLAGFMGKFYLFGAAVQAGFTWLALVGVLNSVVSLYYYVAIIKLMYFREPADTKPYAPPSPGIALAMVLSAISVVALFVAPSPLLSVISNFVSNM
ncbi:MAG: NADH-quinone oxidoreductase subunit N [Candidatus Sericytochromatia bacterium]|nr:NADH-quinone oxidoreductase subunit N [Candidatus Sericytochromatia bacterium]